LLRAKPWKVAEEISKKYNLKVLSANDGMVIGIDEYREG